MELKNKKIVIVGPANPYRGGLATFNERFAKELQLHNEVEICTFTLQYPNFLFPGSSQFTDEKKPENLPIKRVLNSINPLNWIRAGIKYKKQKPDIIIFRYWMPFFGPCFGTFARIIKKNNHTKILAITDNVIPHEKKFYDTICTRYFLSTLNGAITMSRAVLNDLDKFQFKPKKIFNPHPLYDNFGPLLDKEKCREKIQINQDDKVILFFGFIRKYKGLDILLEAMANEEIKNKKIILLVAGEFYEDRKLYDEIIEKNNLQNTVKLHTHFIPNNEVASYFCACDLVVQPYRDATQSGVSQVAYHFEKPMIVTNVGGLAEFIPHGKVGYVCDPNSKDIAKHIIEFFNLNNPEIFHPNLVEIKKQFSWQMLVNNMGELL